jgi:quinol monooxygenase YgiN
MAKLANIVVIAVRPGNSDGVLATLLAHKERSLKDEPGTVQFEVLKPLDDESRLMTYEVYEDEAAFELHRGAASLAQFLRETKDIVAGLSATRCALIE